MTILSKYQQALKDSGMDGQGILRNVPTDCRICGKPIDESHLHASLFNGMCPSCKRKTFLITTLDDGAMAWSVPGQYGKKVVYQYDGCSCANGQITKQASCYPYHSYKVDCPTCRSRYQDHEARAAIIETMFAEGRIKHEYNTKFNEEVYDRVWKSLKKRGFVPKGTKTLSDVGVAIFKEYTNDDEVVEIRQMIMDRLLPLAVAEIEQARKTYAETVAYWEAQGYTHLFLTAEEKDMA